MKYSKIVTFIIFIQIIVIGYFGYVIYKNKTSVLGDVQVVKTIDKSTVQMGTIDSLEHFYEYIPGYREDIPSKEIPYAGHYTINEDTLNERYDYSVKKSNNTYRIITLGDSFTHGLYVDTRNNWTELLEDSFNVNLSCQNIDKVEVINLGVEGYDIHYAIERFKKRGLKYSPDLVIWFLKQDDYIQVNEVMQGKWKYYSKHFRKTGEHEKLVAEGNLRPAWNTASKETFEELGLERILEIQRNHFKDFTAIYSGPLIVLNFQKDPEEVTKFYQEFVASRPNTYLNNQITSYRVDESLFLENDGHPNEEGHKVIAKEVYEYIQQKNIMPCE